VELNGNSRGSYLKSCPHQKSVGRLLLSKYKIVVKGLAYENKMKISNLS
jgi:hypothetical protein